YGPETVWEHLPYEVQQAVIDKKLRMFVINAHKVANSVGLKGRINSIMQTSFFAISGILPREQAIAQIKQSIKKTYGKRGETVVQKNFQAVDETLTYLYEVQVPVETPATALVGAEATSSQRHSPAPMQLLQ